MDYGKYSYIKLTELSEEQSKEYKNVNNALEYSLPVINHQVSTSAYTLNITKVKLDGKTYFQNNLVVSAESSGEIIVELLLDGVVVESISRLLSIGESALLLMKTYSPKASAEVDIDIRIKCATQNFAVNVLSNFLAVWGAVADLNAAAPSTIRSLVVGNQVIVSFADKSTIYYATTNLQTQSITRSQFSQLGSGISHCFALDKSNNLFLFRVDHNKNLYFCNFGENQSETLVDSDISVVYAACCPQTMREDILICYIKNGKPKYRTYQNQSIGGECNFDCPAGEYVDVYIAKANDLDRMYVVCTDKKGHNYILISQKDSMLSGFTENLAVAVSFSVSRYVTYKNLTNSIAENIGLDAAFSLETNYLAYQQLFSSGLNENISASASFDCSKYTRQTNAGILYTLEYNQKVAYSGINRIEYGGDAATWTSVKPNVPTSAPLGPGNFVDAGNLNQKWPFKEIKPCLMQNGQIVGYLQANDFSKFEDGTSADIYSGAYDVMIQFPKMYWKIEEDWDGLKNVVNTTRAKIKISVSSSARDGFVCPAHTRAGREYDYIYVGAYESQISNGNLYCCSGKLPTSDLSHIQTLAQWSNLRGAEYTTLDYHFTTYLYILNMLYFGEHYGYTLLGNGWTTATISNIEQTGTLDQAGMFYGTSDYGVGGNGSTEILVHNKLFGLENIWGHCKTHVDGILYDESRQYLIIDPTNQNSSHNLTATGFNAYSTGVTGNYAPGSWVTLFTANNNYGFLPVAISTTNTNKAYNELRWSQYRPSSYRYFTANSDCPHMMFTYGGDNIRHSGFGFQADRDFDVTNIYHNERIMCYPTSKLST